MLTSWQFFRPAYEGGSWWLLFTSQWAHLSLLHAAANALAAALIAMIFFRMVPWLVQLIAFLGGFLGVAVVIAADPNCLSYAGASGALHGMLAGNAWHLLVANKADSGPRARYLMGFGLLILLGMLIKIVVQHATATAAPGWLGFVTYYPAHEAGALGGLLTISGLVFLCRRPQPQRGTR